MENRIVNIVVVDDEDVVREPIVLLLQSLKAQHPLRVRGAKNGKEALAICHGEKVDIVITDFNMPEMDGIQLREHLRDELSKEEGPEHIVLMSANGTLQESDFKGIFSKFLPKPLSRTQLMEVVALVN